MEALHYDNWKDCSYYIATIIMQSNLQVETRLANIWFITEEADYINRVFET